MRRPLLRPPAALFTALALVACDGSSDTAPASKDATSDLGLPDEPTADAPLPDVSTALDRSATDASRTDVVSADRLSRPDATTASDPRAWLHVDAWSIFWNDRTRCGAERTFLDICERRRDDCALYRRAWEACDPARVVYGQVGPSQQGERLCQRGRFPDVGGCDARRYDFDRLRFSWYGAEWQGNWPFATVKVFPAGTREPSALLGAGMVAFSSLPGAPQAAMGGVTNHGLDRDGDGRPDRGACVMRGATTGDAAYQSPFGAFAWIELPTGRPVTLVVAAGTNFADRAFSGCSRGAATQSPWVTSPPGAQLGCVYVIEQEFQSGRHYVFRYGRVEALTGTSPPTEIIDGFMRAGVDVRDATSCAR
jgi:hypothetical protein